MIYPFLPSEMMQMVGEIPAPKPSIENKINKYVTSWLGDCLDVLPVINKTVQTIVTSPPYFGLRDYGIPPSRWPAVRYAPLAGLPEITIPAQDVCLGLEETIEAYIGHLVHVFRHARHLLAEDGTVWLNAGDSYSQTDKWGGSSGGKNYTSDLGGIPRKKRELGIPTKNLLMVPARLALALQAEGWYLRSEIIWHKPNVMPESVKDRPTHAHEQIFLLSKSEKYYYDYEAIKEPAQDWGSRDRTNGKYHNEGTGLKPHSGLEKSYEQRNKRSVWSVPTKPYTEAHFAVFPPDLIEPCILAGSKPGDVVLDMFGGSGTTAMVATKHKRRSILIEVNPEYVELQTDRTDAVQFALVS